MNTEVSDETLWGLEEPTRFPMSAVNWELAEGDFTIERPQRFDGRKPYAFRAFPNEDDRILAGIKRLLIEKAHDFRVASESIKPEAWRLLFYRGLFTAESLTAFRFHAEPALRQLCVVSEDGDPPEAWLGSGRSIVEISTELEMTLREIGEDPASAAWLILCLAQLANLSKAELLYCRWWDPAWIKGLTANIRFAS